MALAAALELAAEEEGEGPARWDLARRARSLGPAACRDGLAAEAEAEADAEAARRTALRPMAAAAAAAVICASGGKGGGRALLSLLSRRRRRLMRADVRVTR